jgi:hypothetical protein
MFFCNPPIDVEVAPWVRGSANAGISLREATIRNSESFGLPSLERIAAPPARVA